MSDGQSHDLAALSPATLAHARPKLMAHVGQNPMILKREQLSACFRPNDPRLERAMAALDLPAALVDRVAGEVSGGEQQRVLLQRAIQADCPILLLDEPFTNLDSARTDAVAELLTHTAQDGRMVILSAHQTHDFARKV